MTGSDVKRLLEEIESLKARVDKLEDAETLRRPIGAVYRAKPNDAEYGWEYGEAFDALLRKQGEDATVVPTD
jgi:hypothetical protein